MTVRDIYSQAVADGDQLDDGYFQGAGNAPWYEQIAPTNTTLDEGLISFSSSIFQTATARSTDTGATWAAGGYTTGYLPTTSGAAGCAILNSSNTARLTTNSGFSWAAASVAPANMTACRSISMGSTTVAACGGTVSSGVSIYYSSDGGDNWTVSASGPTAECRAVRFASATVAYAIDSSGNIWKSTDAAVNWTDTTDNVTSGTTDIVMYCYTTDIVYFMSHNGSVVKKYVNSTNTFTNNLFRVNNNDGGGDMTTSLPVLATNGDLYWLVFNGPSGTALYSAIICRLDMTNNRLYVKMFPGVAFGITTNRTYFNTSTPIPVLVEDGANTIHFNIDGFLYKIVAKGDT